MKHLLSRSLIASLAWITAAGAALACSEPAVFDADAEPRPLVDRLPLRVASYNAWLLPIASRDLGARLDRMPAAIDALAPDVLCLQEAWFPFQRDVLEAGLEHRLPHTTYGGGGVALMSRYPIVEERYYGFADDEALSLTERLGGKGVFEVILRTPAGPLRVVGTHLALDRNGRGGHERQLVQLRERLAARPELPTVFCADLNTRAVKNGALDDGYALIMKLGYRDTLPPARRADGSYGQRPTTRVGWPRGERRGRGWSPDFIMVRGAADGPALTVVSAKVTLDDEATALSDHNLLLADLVIGSAPRSAH